MNEYKLISIMLVEGDMILLKFQNVKTSDELFYRFNKIYDLPELDFLGIYIIEFDHKVGYRAETIEKAEELSETLPIGSEITIPFCKKYFLTNVETGLVHEAVIEETVKIQN